MSNIVKKISIGGETYDIGGNSMGATNLKDGDIIVVSLDIKQCPQMDSPDGLEYLNKYCEYLSEIFPNNKIVGQPHFIDIQIIKNMNSINSSDDDSSLFPF